MKSNYRLNQKGQGMTEYILIVALIAVAVIGAVKIFGGKINSGFKNAGDQIGSAVNNNGSNAADQASGVLHSAGGR